MTNSGGESDELSGYFREIAQHSLLGPHEEIELARQMLDGGCAEHALARQRLLQPILAAQPECSGRTDPGPLLGGLALERVVFRYRPDGPAVLALSDWRPRTL